MKWPFPAKVGIGVMALAIAPYLYALGLMKTQVDQIDQNVSALWLFRTTPRILWSFNRELTTSYDHDFRDQGL
jgi:hypothetical protein